MTEQLILRELHSLPEALKVEVLHFVQFLKWKHGQQFEEEPHENQQAGSSEKEISVEDDWNAPMELVYLRDLEALEAKAGVKIKR